MKVHFLLAFLSLVLAIPNPLQGVWEGHFTGTNVSPGQVNCLLTVQFLPLDYLCIISGCGSASANGVSTGLYFLGEDVITVYFAGSEGAGGVPGTYIDIDWSIDSQGRLHLTDPNGAWDEIYTKLGTASYDGVWSGQTTVNGTVVADVYAEFLSTTYLSFPRLYDPNYGAFIGLATLNQTSNQMPVYYGLANGENSAIIGNTVQTDFTPLNPGFSLDHSPYASSPQEEWIFTATQKQSTNTVLQGVWIGYTAGCATTIDFRANLFRAYQTSCANVQNTGLHFGVWASSPTTTNTMTSLTLYYAYSTFGLEETNQTFTISILQGDTIFHLTGPNVDGNYYKVSEQATTTILLLTVQGDHSTFASSEAGFLADLSTATSIAPELIIIRDSALIDSSQFTVTVQFSDDPSTGAKAINAGDSILAAPQLGDYTVSAYSVILKPYGNDATTLGAMNSLYLLVSLIAYGVLCFN